MLPRLRCRESQEPAPLRYETYRDVGRSSMLCTTSRWVVVIMGHELYGVVKAALTPSFRRDAAKHLPVNGATCWLHQQWTRSGSSEHGVPLRRRTPRHLDRCRTTCSVVSRCKRLPSRHVCGQDQRLLALVPLWLRREFQYQILTRLQQGELRRANCHQ